MQIPVFWTHATLEPSYRSFPDRYPMFWKQHEPINPCQPNHTQGVAILLSK